MADVKEILLVEDDRMLAAHWRGLLERQGYRVIHESDVSDAISTLERVPVDLVITGIVFDGQEPGAAREGGLEIISYVALNLDPCPKLVVTSEAVGHSEFVDRNFDKLNARRALRKPIADADLVSAVASAIADITESRPTETSEEALIGGQSIDASSPSSCREPSPAELRDTLQLLRAIQHDLRKTQFVMDHSGDAVFWIAEDGRLLYVNESACAMLGYAESELLNLNVSQIDVSSGLAEWREKCELLRSQGPSQHETVFRSKTSAEVEVEVRLHHYEYGDEVFVVALAQGIGQRKAAERKLKNVSESLNAMVRLLGATDGVWDWDVRSGHVDYAPGFRRLLGFGGEDRRGLPDRFESLENRVHPDDWERLRASIDRCFESRSAFTCEFRLRNLEGNYVWVRSQGNAAFDDDGQPIRLVGSTHNIDEMKSAELALKRTQAALDTAPDAVIWVRPDSTIAYANETACTRLGYTQKELLNLPVGSLHRGGISPERFASEIWNKLTSKGKYIFESTHQTKGGELLEVEISTRLIEFGDEKFACSFVRDIADRLERDRLLDDMQKKVQLAAKAGNVGFWDWDVSTHEVSYSDEWHLQLGEQPGTLRGYDAFATRVHPEDLAGVEGLVRECLEGVNESFRHTFRMKHADGTWRWILSAGKLILSAESVPALFAGIHIDVTSEQLAIQEQERFFSVAVDMFAVVDLGSQTFTKVSPNWEEITGYSKQDLFGTTLPSMCHVEDRSDLMKAIESLSKGEMVRGTVLRWLCEDGMDRYLEFNADPPADGDLSVFVTARDVTETDTQVFRSMSRVVPQVLYIYDLTRGIFTFQSRGLAESLGHDPDEIYEAGQPVLETLAHPDDRTNVQQHLERIKQAEDQDILELEYRIRDATGEYQRFLGRNTVFKRGSDGTVQQFVGTVTNLDELEILKRYAKQLEEVNSELHQFTYIASHDLKQPLRGIDNLAKWIQEDCDDVLPEESKTHLRTIGQRISRMERLVNDLLAYSRAGRSRSKSEEADLESLVNGMRDDFEMPDTIQLRYVGDSIRLKTVVVELEVVLRNLIGNSIKHSVDQPSLTVAASTVGDKVEISVTDKGPGIAPEYHDKIFGMFQTLKSRDDVEGSGMGLAIVKKMVKANGGDITVESEVGQGATFRFTWPRDST